MKKMTKILTVLFLVVGLSTAWSAPAEGTVQTPNKKLYDFSFVDMNFEAVFSSVSVIAGVDIILAPEVKGKTSLKVTKKTWHGELGSSYGQAEHSVRPELLRRQAFSALPGK